MKNKTNTLAILLIIILLCSVGVLLFRITGLFDKIKPVTEYEVGDIIEFKNLSGEMAQEFYVLSSDRNTITLLSKENILVGNVFNTETNTLEEVSKDKYGYGLQTSEATGFNTNYTVYNGVVAYDENCYENKNCNSYNSLSGFRPSINDYLDAYKNVLINDYQLNIREIRLLNEADFLINGMLISELADAIRNHSSFWYEGNAYQNGRTNAVIDNGSIGEFDANVNNKFGVRPVIVISK